MKQIRISLLVMLTLFLVCGCTNVTPSTTIDTSTAETRTETNSPEIIECATSEGLVTQESVVSNTPCKIYLTKKSETENAPCQLLLTINTETAVLEKELADNASPRPSGSLLLADVDGDGTQEILVHHDTEGSGGYGAWQTWVLKVEGEEIRILFENFNEFDTGFESRFLEGYQLEITNRITGYTLVFAVKEGHKAYIDNAGEIPEDSIIADSFYVFEPKDTDNDGISEILCKQYTSIFGHSDYTGTACSVLKFNKDTQAFDVVDAWYEPNTDE